MLRALLLVSLIIGHPVSAIAQNTAKPLKIAKISSNPKKQIQRILPFGKYLVDTLAQSGYTHAEVVVVQDRNALFERASVDNIDIVTATAATAQALTQSGMFKPIALRWKKGQPEYSSILVARKTDDSIHSINDLGGKRVVFEDTSSTSGFTIPAGEIVKQNFTLKRLSSPRITFQPSDNSVGFLLGNTEETTFAWVHKGLADVGAFSDSDWQDPDKTPAQQRQQLKIIWQSKMYPRAIILVSTALSEPEISAIKETLLAAHNDPLANHALTAFHKTTKFETLSKDHLAALEEIGGYIQYTEHIK